MRVCSKCGESKPAVEFYSSARKVCKLCRRAQARQYHNSRPDVVERRVLKVSLKAAKRAQPRLTCSKCDQLKPRADFYTDNNGRGAHSWCKVCCRKYERKRTKHRLPADRRRWTLKYRYGLSPSDVSARLCAQSGRCAVCGKPLMENFYIDHNHATDDVRGILCCSCNVAIGLFKDKPELLEQAVEYLSGEPWAVRSTA